MNHQPWRPHQPSRSNWFPDSVKCHTRICLKAMKLPSMVYRRYSTEEIWSMMFTSTYMECILYHMTVYYRKLRHVHWEVITTSCWRDIAIPSWDFSSFLSVSPTYGIISQQKWYLHHRWGKTGQILRQLSVLTGARNILKILIIDQPKGRPGLISKAEEEGKGKGIGVTIWNFGKLCTPVISPGHKGGQQMEPAGSADSRST